MVTGAFWGTARYRETDGDEFSAELELEMDRDVEIRRLLLKSGGRNQIQEVEIDGADPGDFACMIDQGGDLVVDFPEPLLLPESCPVTVAYRLK